ncbi:MULTISPECIES: C40 family peptidase [unclassified Streptomyces]|uniref:C40 family peptidase n=1 Tax=unclassified Streptomyces TaxID=2593676 RepID=UPI00226E0293|nr:MULTISPECIES: C40 family peptidase [unclassified Streptomyces]MCY0919707.1 C40 family peptidase [Streptomyces sp. H27-G5]MCY0955514.1 C40 family peptidase [Streptomyces sp. H27-H5]
MPHSTTDARKALFRRKTARLASPLLVLVTIATPAGTVVPAQAAPAYGNKALAVAASKEGAPYARGATGPERFDCSGLMLYAFRQAGKKLPRTAEQQYAHTRPVPSVQRAAGDLVFFPKGSTVGHVGIYAGNDKLWHAPRPGASVRLERIWTGNVRYGRAT